MSDMAMVFFTSTRTPLYSNTWTPLTTGRYAGTCIFLIVFAVIFQGLFAIRAILQRGWQEKEVKRRYNIAGNGETAGVQSSDSVGMLESDTVGLKSEGPRGNHVESLQKVRPWRLTEDLPRACLDVVIAGVGYLLYVVLQSRLAILFAMVTNRDLVCWRS